MLAQSGKQRKSNANETASWFPDIALPMERALSASPAIELASFWLGMAELATDRTQSQRNDLEKSNFKGLFYFSVHFFPA